MKTTISIHSLVWTALPVVTDREKLQQACDAYANSMKSVSVEARAGNLRESKKNNDARVRETVETTWSGERNIVSNFLDWNGRVSGIASKAEKIGCQLTVVEIPPRFATWLAKFAKPEAPTQAKPKRNGKRNGKPDANEPEANEATATAANA